MKQIKIAITTLFSCKNSRKNFEQSIVFFIGNYNLGHNTLRLFDVLPNSSFTTSETNRDY